MSCSLRCLRFSSNGILVCIKDTTGADLGVDGCEIGVLVREGGDLGGAHEGEVQRVEEQHHVLALQRSRAQDAALVLRLVATLERFLVSPESQLQALVPAQAPEPHNRRARLRHLVPLCAALAATTVYLVGCAVMRGQVQAFVAQSSGE